MAPTQPTPLSRRARTRAATAFVFAAVMAALLLSACGNSDEESTKSSAAAGSAASRPIKVVATTTQLGDIVRNIGGAGADVTQILQPNSDPHDYEPRPDDVTAIAGAKVVFESGNNLDSWMADVVRQSGGSPVIVTLADSNVDRLPGETSGPEASRYDPHWWHDPANVEAAVPVIRDALTTADPPERAIYAANATAYLRRLRALDTGIRRCFATVPPSQRRLVTDHDAFNYFAKRYAIDVIGAVIPSQTTQAQPSAGEVARLVRTIKDENVRAIFPESSVNPKLAQAIARETGATADHTLYGDTLGPADSSGGTYLTMEQANADQMVRGFTGDRRGCTIRGL